MRDISASINSLAHCALLAEDFLYISDSIKNISYHGKETFRDKYKLNTIVDTESNFKPHNSGTNDVFGQCNPSSNMGTCHLFALTYCWISLRSGQYAKKVMQRLSIWSRWYLVTDVIYARGPIHETFDVLDTAQTEICDLFSDVLSRDHTYPLMICGKNFMRDQSLLLLLILLLIGVPLEHIQNDFGFTVQQIESCPSQNKGESDFLKAILLTDKHWISAVAQYLDESFGGIENYLISGGVSRRAISAIRKMLLQDPQKS
ncbi:hypothetical protein D6D13_09786 [Aureobasidium pullulans]|uniref:Uncharacterized protein n=1 Tax=Aureobasidium pullulans TaxID=5580 RepID=A0A4S9C0S7_AURPU|nr:hypothetical protein D6D13_09786 [Aureobasidium pullulans]